MMLSSMTYRGDDPFVLLVHVIGKSADSAFVARGSRPR